MTSSRAAKRSVWLAALGLATAATPPALAAEGGAPPLPDPTELAAGIIEQAGVGSPLPALPIEVPVAQPLELPAAPAQQAAEEPVQTGADAAPPPLPVAEPAPQPALEAAPEAPAPTPDAPPAVAVQQEPTNVNVSIRADSAGDDGAVTQVNVAVGGQKTQYQPDAPQYQPVVPEPAAPAAPSDAVDAAPEPAGEWSWSWDCGSAAFDSLSVPAGVGMQNWNWIWNWNCGGESASSANSNTETRGGYHPVAVQYRPINVNVSIRINSPGSNGPVSQTNVAVGVTVPLPAPAPVRAPVVFTPAQPSPAEAQPAPTAPEQSAAQAEPASETAPVEAAAPEVSHACCLLPEPRGKAHAPERPAGILAGGGATTATGIASLPGDTVAVAARLELQVRRAATAAAQPQRPQLRPAPSKDGRPAPQRRNTDEEPTAATQSGLGIVPIGGPERSLPFAALVLLAFAFASANSSLASVRSRPTHGADADEPPDRPG